MKGIKAMKFVGFLMVVAVALAAPAVASAANWKENGAEITDFGPHWLKDGGSLAKSTLVSLDGTYGFQSSAGGITCSANAGASITSGGDGSILESSLSKCTTSGALKSCTVTSASSGLAGGAFTASEGGVAKVAASSAVFKLTGFFCPKEISVASASLTATPNNSGNISSLVLSGTAVLSVEGKSSANATINGTLAFKPLIAGTYGIGAGPTVALKGSLGSGILACNSVSGLLVLQPGGAGQVTGVSWAGCTATGWLAPLCGDVTSVTTKSLPWGVQNEGTAIGISGISFTVNTTKSCAIDVEGSLAGKPDNTGAISSFTPSGVLQTGGEAEGTMWSGSFNWTPAGWFGL